MGKDKDDIFGVDDDMSFLDEKSKIDTAISPPVETNTSVSTQESVQTNDIGGNGKDGYPKLMGATFPKEYADVVESVMNQYRKLPKIDYDAIYNNYQLKIVIFSAISKGILYNNGLHNTFYGYNDCILKDFP